jgi:hypothetical protein
MYRYAQASSAPSVTPRCGPRAARSQYSLVIGADSRFAIVVACKSVSYAKPGSLKALSDGGFHRINRDREAP